MPFNLNHYQEYDSILSALLQVTANKYGKHMSEIRKITGYRLTTIIDLAREINIHDPRIISVVGTIYRNAYILPTPKTSEFLNEGGFSKLFKNQTAFEREKDAERLMIQTVNQSVIDTNNATQQNLKDQKNFGNISLALGAISVVFIVISTFQTCTDTTSENVKAIQEQLQQNKNTIDTLSNVLKQAIQKYDQRQKNPSQSDSAKARKQPASPISKKNSIHN